MHHLYHRIKYWIKLEAPMFKVGDEVSYGLHGKCVVTGIETKELSSGSVQFYQIRSIKNPITAKSPAAMKKEPAILVPVQSAANNGLRALMSQQEAEKILQILAEPDYHFEIGGPWLSKQKQLEEHIRKDGPIGLAKVVGYLYYLTKQDAVPQTPVMKFFESAQKILIREISDAMVLPSKDVEAIITKALRAKLSIDN